MRKRIWRMSEDRFDYVKPRLELSTEKVELTGIECEPVDGFFVLRSTNGVSVSGIVYSSNPYVICTTPQFEGTENRITFKTMDVKFQDGDVLDGEFTIVTNQNEIKLPYTITFVGARLTTSVGEIGTLQEFVRFAEDNHWTEAIQIFYSDRFEHLMRYQSPKLKLLYKGYRRGAANEKNFEEFLVAAGLKKRTTFTVNERKIEFYNLEENQKESIEITRNTWGYIEIDVHSDNDFVTVEKEKITSDFFLGSNLSLNYYVHKNKLHAGKNVAKITFDSFYEHKEIVIIASPSAKEDVSYVENLNFHKLQYDFTRIYLEYRLNRLTTGDWCNSSLELIDKFEKREEELYEDENEFFPIMKKNSFYQLMKAHALIANRQRQDALWIIQDLKRDIEDKKSVEWAYLLYLCTLIEKEESYVDRLTAEIEHIFNEHSEDVRIFWFLTFLRKEYINNTGQKYQAIKQWVMGGYNSPYLMVEAFYLLSQEPFLMASFDAFNVLVLNFARKHHCITKDLALQVAYILENAEEYNELIYLIAKDAYDAFPEKELQMAIITNLLKNEKFGERYLHWYEDAIYEKMHVTGLYEAYIRSLPEDFAGELPELVTMYFRYDNALPYDAKALVYSNVIGHRSAAPHVYEQYLRTIEDFAVAQLNEGRINDNLAAIYQDLLNLGLISSNIADKMSKLLFTRKIACLSKRITRVILLEEHLREPIIRNVYDGITYMPILSENFVLLLETDEGTLIADSESCYIEQMIHYERFYEDIRKNAAENLDYIIHDFSTRFEAGDFKREDLQYIENFLNSDALSLEYKSTLYSKILPFLREHSREDILEKHLLLMKPYMYLDSKLMTYMIGVAINNGFYDEAYGLVTHYNGWSVDPQSLIKLCNYRIVYQEFASDDFLITLAAALLSKDTVSEQTVGYLNRYYMGPTNDMMRVWKLTVANRMKSEQLAERLIMQMLFTENIVESCGELFERYMEHNPNRMVVEAYLTFFARRYLISDESVPSVLFLMLEKYYLLDVELNDSCKIALMKYLANMKELSEKRYDILNQLIRTFIRRNIYFAFYKKADMKLQIKYHLYDKTFVEYRTTPGKKLRFVYENQDGEVVEEDMIEMYEGIYVKQVVLFFGDSLKYNIYSEDSMTPIAASSAVYEKIDDAEEEGRYALLNSIQNAICFDEDEHLSKDMKRYQGLDEVTKQLFTVI